MEDFYITFANLYASDSASSEAYEQMLLKVNNTKATLLRLLESNYEGQSRLVEASITFTGFCIQTGDHSEKLISQAVQYIQRNSDCKKLLIESFQKWGRLYEYSNDLEEA